MLSLFMQVISSRVYSAGLVPSSADMARLNCPCHGGLPGDSGRRRGGVPGTLASPGHGWIQIRWQPRRLGVAAFAGGVIGVGDCKGCN